MHGGTPSYNWVLCPPHQLLGYIYYKPNRDDQRTTAKISCDSDLEHLGHRGNLGIATTAPGPNTL